MMYPYRTARLINWTCCIPLSDLDFAYLRRRLLKDGFGLDNHICFSTTHGNFMYSDNRLYVGGEIVKVVSTVYSDRDDSRYPGE